MGSPRQLKLTGYSKLNKPALIDKLLACPALSSLSVAAAAAASLGAPSVAAHHAPPAPGQTPSGPSAAHSTAQGWNDLISWPDEAAEPSANALIGGEVDLVGLSAGRPSAAHTPVPRPSVAPHARGQTPSSTAALPSADLPPPSASSASAGAPGKKKQKKTKAAKAAHTASAPGPPRPPHAPPSAVPPASSVASREASSSPSKRPAVAQPTVEPPAKKQTVGSKTVVGSSSAAARKTFKPLAIAPQPVPPTVLPPAASPPGSSTPVLSTPAASTVAPRPPKAKSTFRAPVPKASTAAPKPPTKISRPAETSPALLQSDSLSFAPVQDDAAAVNPITLPPPLRARAKVHTLALLVSALERPERDAVALSGKAGRYAGLSACALLSIDHRGSADQPLRALSPAPVFLSAYHRLQRRFPGARLLTFLSHSSVDSSTSNLWPYLRAREHEVSVRRAAVQSSWLARLWSAHQLGTPGADPAFDAVADRLYGSPDDPIQLAVALRVVLARLHTALAVVPDARELQHGGLGRVVGARKVAEGVWRIDWVRKVTSGEAAGGDVKESLLVLEEARRTSLHFPVSAEHQLTSDPSLFAPGRPASRSGALATPRPRATRRRPPRRTQPSSRPSAPTGAPSSPRSSPPRPPSPYTRRRRPSSRSSRRRTRTSSRRACMRSGRARSGRRCR